MTPPDPRHHLTPGFQDPPGGTADSVTGHLITSDRHSVTVAHHAEAFRQGYVPNVRWGWHCLTCDVEEYVETMAEAVAGAEAHTNPPKTTARPIDLAKRVAGTAIRLARMAQEDIDLLNEVVRRARSGSRAPVGPEWVSIPAELFGRIQARSRDAQEAQRVAIGDDDD